MKVTFSGICISDGSGKLGGTVFQHGRYGSIARNNFRPLTSRAAYPQTNQQKSLFATIASGWRSLSPANQDAWRAAATPPMTGFGFYQQLNLNYYKFNGGLISSPPLSFFIGSIASVSVVISHIPGANTFTYTGTPGGGIPDIALYGINNLSPGVGSPRNSEYRFLEFASMGLGTHHLTFDPRIKNVNLIIGSKTFIKWKIVDEGTGFMTAGGVISAICI